VRGCSYWFQIGRIVFGAYDTQRGFGRLNQTITHPKTLVTGGIHENECSQLVKDFFKGKAEIGLNFLKELMN
jgi:tRNA(adenine34) deaminase